MSIYVALFGLPVIIWLGFLVSAFRKENTLLSEGCSGNCNQGRLPCDEYCTRNKEKMNEQ